MVTIPYLLIAAQATLVAPPPAKPVPAELAPIAKGPFEASLDSLKGNRYPDWFRNGKLGIWAHWGPQAVPMEGDWYARQMYEQGSKDYNDHLKRWGHPSQHGYKDLIPLWKAEKWDPNRLMGLYKLAGARYFVSMGVHHDNFDLWNSTYHRWNAVNLGPKRDVVGDWQKAAKKLGLHFGVSEHLGASMTWFQVSHTSDKEGPMKGVPYDGADPAYADLYHWPANPGDTSWYSNDPRWHAEWYARVKDLIDQYHPDLLYSDGGIPFGKVGEALVAHFYNDSVARHGGKQEAVYNCKQPSGGRWAQDVERGVMPGILPQPWQTDTSIGDWYYNKGWKFRGADWVLHTLIDVVSKNGNLLINVVQRPDGSLDKEAEQVLADMAAWMKVNGESIYDTRPWLIHGEGPVRAKGGAFKEDFKYTAQDVRFASKGDGTLYVTLMGRPDANSATIHSLASGDGVTAKLDEVTLLGSKAKLHWEQGPDGLKVDLPEDKLSDIAVVLKVSGKNLRGFKPELTAPARKVITIDPQGTTLKAQDAEPHGEGINTEERGGQTNLGFWDHVEDWADWSVDFPVAETYEVTLTTAAPNGATQLLIDVSGAKLKAEIPATSDWGAFTETVVGKITVSKTGKQTLSVRPADPATWKAINLRSVRLKLVRD